MRAHRCAAANTALWVFDESGKAAKITIADVSQSNGVIHVIEC